MHNDNIHVSKTNHPDIKNQQLNPDSELKQCHHQEKYTKHQNKNKNNSQLTRTHANLLLELLKP